MLEGSRHAGAAQQGVTVGAITELVVRCGHGDEEALGRLLDLFYSPVRAAISQQLPTRPVDGLVMEAFVHLWRRAPSYRPGEQGPVEWVMDQVASLAPLAPQASVPSVASAAEPAG